jgi:UDP-3-O-[3-hydroxymyristoyl] glucosamine N-acyltransferase
VRSPLLAIYLRKNIFMKFEHPVPIKFIADLVGAEIVGNSSRLTTGINEIHKVERGDLVYVDNPKYYATCLQSAATFIIIDKRIDFPAEKILLIIKDPFEAYLKIVRYYRPFRPSMKMISRTTSLASNVVVMPNVYIGNNVRVGKNSIIFPNVTILDHCIIGNEVIIQAGTVIGSDAFYYNRKEDRDIRYKKMNSCGRVIIEDSVEIGAGCTIDRGVSHDTVIGRGTKIDNLVHIGHDTIIGQNCLLAGQVGIAGASTLEDNVTLWGQVGVSKTLTIGRNAVVYAQSGVPASLQGGNNYFGSPAIDAKEKMKELVWLKRIPELWGKVMAKK